MRDQKGGMLKPKTRKKNTHTHKRASSWVGGGKLEMSGVLVVVMVVLFLQLGTFKPCDVTLMMTVDRTCHVREEYSFLSVCSFSFFLFFALSLSCDLEGSFR